MNTDTPRARVRTLRAQAPRRAPRPARPRRALALLLSVGLAGGTLAAALSGCSQRPLFGDEGDYAQRVSLQRLRSIERLDLDAARRAGASPAAQSQADASPIAVDVSRQNDAVAEARRRFDALERYELTLEEARAAVLANNLDLRVARVDPAIARTRVSEEEARWELAFTTRALWQDLEQPTASELAAASSNTQSIEPGVRIPLRTGGTATVTLPIARNETNNRFSTLNPAITSDLQFSISHNLLRGAGRRANTAQLRIAGYDEQSARAQTTLEVIRQVAAADRAYWRLYQARRNLEVAQQQYELAAEQLERARRRVAAGALAEIERIRAEAGLAQRLEGIITTQNQVLLQQRELKRILNIPGLTVETLTLVTPATDPDPVEYLFDAPALIAGALDRRMEMLDLELRLASDAASIALARNQALPLLALDYTYRVNGLGRSFNSSVDTLSEATFDDWTLGLNFEVPIGNEAARSRVRRALLQRVQRLATRDAREQSIRQEVLGAVDTINAGWQRILAARQSVILNTRALQAEQRQFDQGLSTSTDVLDAAARLAESQAAEVRALADYQIAQVDLAFATGTLLGAARVDWEEALGTEPDPDLSRPDPVEELPERLRQPAATPPPEDDIAPAPPKPEGDAPAPADPDPARPE
jgi:outer membrane protein TolC